MLKLEKSELLLEIEQGAERRVNPSMRRLFLRSTKILFLVKKSAPIMGRLTSATVKGHLKFRRNPKETPIIFSPYVSIGEEFAANNLKSDGLSFLEGGGMTEISAPVSMRNFNPEALSKMIRRWVEKGLPTFTALNDGLVSLNYRFF